MSICQGVLLDTVSIQQYIFQSNELKENVGASYIIGDLIYGAYLKEAVENVLPSFYVDLEKWKEPPFDVRGCEPFEIGYIGGGNALLLFKKYEDANAFIRRWTRILMVKAPHVNTAIALDKVDLTKFHDSIKYLFRKLQYNKLRFSQQTVVPAHGITAECTRSGFSQNKWNRTVETFVSAASNARIQAGNVAWKDVRTRYKDILNDRFDFTNDLSELNQIEEDSYIAIVHIDGNDISNFFLNPEINSLPRMRENAVTIDDITRSSFERLLSHMTESGVIENKDTKKKIIPIRPIVLEGDDITFVCDGKLGIYLTEKYMEFFEDESRKKGLELTTCAGIAIIKCKYPFYRGCCLAEELCKNAKTIRKKERQQCSYLDFHIASGAIVGSLNKIRTIHYRAPQGRLHCRPYRLTKGIRGERDFPLLVNNAKKLIKDFPSNKRHELRKVLTMNKTARDHFLAEIKARKRELPMVPSKDFNIYLFDSITVPEGQVEATPYMDMIELIEFYPFSKLQDS